MLGITGATGTIGSALADRLAGRPATAFRRFAEEHAAQLAGR